MLEIWNIVNGIKNLVNAKPCDIKFDNLYVVNYNEEKYRAKLISVPSNRREKYKVRYYVNQNNC